MGKKFSCVAYTVLLHMLCFFMVLCVNVISSEIPLIGLFSGISFVLNLFYLATRLDHYSVIWSQKNN